MDLIVEESLKLSRPRRERARIQIADTDDARKIRGDVRHTKQIGELRGHPLVVRDRVDAPGDEQGLQELMVSVIKAFEGVERVGPSETPADVVDVVEEKGPRRLEPFSANFLVVEWQPLVPQVVVATGPLKERAAIGDVVAESQLEIIRS